MSDIQPVLSFDGIDDYISVPDCPALRIEHYTVELWLKPKEQAKTVWEGILGKPGRNFNIWLHRDGFIHHRFHTDRSTNAGAPNTPKGSIQRDRWSHVAITNDGQAAKTYINGELESEGPTNGKLIIDNQPLYISRNLDGKNGRYFQGQMVDIRIWSQVHSLEEIQRSMGLRLCGDEPGLVMYWPSDEGKGETVGDRTKNKVSGTLHGVTWESEELEFISPMHAGRFSGPCAPGTALEDIGFWYRWKKSLPQESQDKKPFRRGRIWS